MLDDGYDPAGRLEEVMTDSVIQVTLPDGSVSEYVVDGFGRRVGKKVDGTPVQGLLDEDQLNPVAELDGTGALVSRFVYATRSHVPSYMVKGGVTYRIVSDHLGSVRLVIDESTGTVAQRLEYDEFGRVLTDTNPGLQPFGFAGGLYDADTGFTRFGARDYDPAAGRWTAKDPIEFQGGDPNLYGYVLQDPVSFVDPSGHVFVDAAFFGKALYDLLRCPSWGRAADLALEVSCREFHHPACFEA